MKLAEAIQNYELTGLEQQPKDKKAAAFHAWVQSEILSHLGETEVETISTSFIEGFLWRLNKTYEEIHGKKMSTPDQDTAQLIIYRILRWASFELAIYHREELFTPDHSYFLQAPFSQQEIQALLEAAEALGTTKAERREGRVILLGILETGAWPLDLCRLKVQDIDIESRTVHIRRHVAVEVSDECITALTKHIISSGSYSDRKALVFTMESRRYTQDDITSRLTDFGHQAKIADVTPIRFRRTFAVNCLRQFRNFYKVQIALGYSTMFDTLTYLEVTHEKMAADHRKASPVDRLKP